jgi:MFS family permease
VTGIELFMRGSSLDIAALNIANVAGPLLGGLLAGVIGTKAVFLVIAGCFLVAALFSVVAAVPSTTLTQRQPLRARVIWAEVRKALNFLVNNKLLRYLLLLNFVASLGWTTPDVAAVVYLTNAPYLNGGQFGLLHATMSLSIALTVYILGHLSGRLPRARVLVAGVAVAGLAYTFVLLRPGLTQLLLIWAVSGLGWGAHWLMDEALWAEATPNEIRGRVYSLAEAAVALVAVAAALLGGRLVDSRGPLQALAIIGLAMATGALLVTALTKGYRTISQ